MTPSQKWMKKAKNPIGYITTIAVVCVIWLVLGCITANASQETGICAATVQQAMALFIPAIPPLAIITAIIRAIVCLIVSAAFKLLENGIRFVKRI